MVASSKDMGMLWHHYLLERIMGSYRLKLPNILCKLKNIVIMDTGYVVNISNESDYQDS